MDAENLTTRELSTLEKFKAKAHEFINAFNTLASIDKTSLTESEREEYDSLYSQGNIVKKTIEAITSAVDSVTNFFSDLFNFDGVSQVKKSLELSGRQQLGVLPLIPIAAVLGAIAAMTAFIGNVYLFERKVTERKSLENQGYSPEQAAQIVAQSQPGALTASIMTIAKPALFITGGFLLLKFITSMRATR